MLKKCFDNLKALHLPPFERNYLSNLKAKWPLIQSKPKSVVFSKYAFLFEIAYKVEVVAVNCLLALYPCPSAV